MIDCLWLSVDRLKSTFYRVLLSRRFAPSAGESWTQKGKKLVACLEWTHAVAVILAERDRRRDLPHITWWAKTGRDSPIKGRRLLGLGKDVSCLVRKKILTLLFQYSHICVLSVWCYYECDWWKHFPSSHLFLSRKDNTPLTPTFATVSYHEISFSLLIFCSYFFCKCYTRFRTPERLSSNAMILSL